MKAKLNLIIDALLLLCLAAIAGIGILIKHVLVPGAEAWEIHGRSVDLLFLGLDRHEWGTIHYAVGVTFAGLVVLHVVLHWGMVLRMFARLVPNRPARWVAGAGLAAAAVFLLSFSALVEPEVREGGRAHRRSRRQTRPKQGLRLRQRNRGAGRDSSPETKPPTNTGTLSRSNLPAG